MKSLTEIAWDVDEETYRADSALSYSALAKYARGGFDVIDSIYDKLDTPSLTFGSAVDALITGGQEEFDKKFMVADFPTVKDSVKSITKNLFANYGNTYPSLLDIPNEIVIAQTEVDNFQMNWKPETRAKVIKEQGSEYYSLLYLAEDRTVLTTEEKLQIDNTVMSLYNNPDTAKYLRKSDNSDIEVLFQLKFKDTFLCEDTPIEYRCMADSIVVDHKNKIIYPVDLKTSSKAEWNFYKSFLEWSYMIQARLYYRLIASIVNKDPYFREFTIDNYRFIVANKTTLTPLVWVYEDTQTFGTLYYGKYNQIECKDPFQLGYELNYYLSSRPKTPIGIKAENSLTSFLKQV